MAEQPVIILGAGATKACGGPLTDEILPLALNGQMMDHFNSSLVKDREDLLPLTDSFLQECFNVPASRPVQREDCPSLPMVLSMLRRSIEANQNIGNWQGERLIHAKRSIEYAIFAVIEATLRSLTGNFHHDLLEPIYARPAEPCVISLNYDVIVDNVMFELSDRIGTRVPDYGVDIKTDKYLSFRSNGTRGQLLKLHGSLNWMFCEKCKRLDLFVSEEMHSRKRLVTAKALDELYHFSPFKEAYSCRGTTCRNAQCGGSVSPILITPTYVKDYENPHIDQVWKTAENSMRDADRAVIIGYSLPTDDVEIAMLLKRGLDHLPRNMITVVEYVDGDRNRPLEDRMPVHKHPTGQRFRTLFGPGLDWHTTGFQGWLQEQQRAGQFPFAP